MSRFVLAVLLIVPLFNNFVLAEEDGVKAAYQNWQGSFKDLIETLVIVEGSEEDLKHAKWKDLFTLKKEEGTELIEISVVPKAVNVHYMDVYSP